MTLRRLGRDAEAAEVLESIDAGMDVIENHAYHRLLLLYRGERQAGELLAEARAAAGETTAASLTAAMVESEQAEDRSDPRLPTLEEE